MAEGHDKESLDMTSRKQSSKAEPGIGYNPQGSTHGDPFPSTRPHPPKFHHCPITCLNFDSIKLSANSLIGELGFSNFLGASRANQVDSQR